MVQVQLFIRQSSLRDHFGLVRFLVKGKRHSSIPSSFQHRVRQVFAVSTVVPLRQVRVAGGILRWGFNLDAIDATATFKPAKQNTSHPTEYIKTLATAFEGGTRKHWIDAHLSWVSLAVCSSNLNRSLRSDKLKWRSTSSSLSTTQELSAFLCAWRWKIFSSMVPVFMVWIRKRKQVNNELIVRDRSFEQSTYRQKPINETGFLLTVSPYSSHSLIVVGWVPVRIEHNKPVGTYQVKAAPTGFAAEQECKVPAIRIVKPLNNLNDKGACVYEDLRGKARVQQMFYGLPWLSSLYSCYHPVEHRGSFGFDTVSRTDPTSAYNLRSARSYRLSCS